MVVHRDRTVLVIGLVLTGLAGWYALAAPDATAWLGVAAFVALLAGVAVRLLRRFRFVVSEHGLDLHTHGIERLVPWSEIDALVIDRPARRTNRDEPLTRLLLVPSPRSDLAAHLPEASPIDGRPARPVLDFAQVSESLEEICTALLRHGGDRLADGRLLRVMPAEDGRWTVVLRGYERAAVEALVADAERAGAAADPAGRAAARERLRDPRLPVVLRGYDRGQVDRDLDRLAAGLGDHA